MEEKILCSWCKKELKTGMEIEYSQESGDFFCSPDCATSFYFDYMRSVNLDIEYVKLPDGVKATPDCFLVRDTDLEKPIFPIVKEDSKFCKCGTSFENHGGMNCIYTTTTDNGVWICQECGNTNNNDSGACYACGKTRFLYKQETRDNHG